MSDGAVEVYFGGIMEFDPKDLGNALSEEAEFSFDLTDRLIESPVFDHARRLQTELFKTRLSDDDLNEAFNAISEEFLGELDSEASDQGILGQTVLFSGNGLEVPMITADFRTAISFIQVHDTFEMNDENLELSAKLSEIKGGFGGFTVRFVRVEDNPENGAPQYSPRFALQAHIASVNTSNMNASLRATALLDTTSVVFEKDRMREGRHQLVARLLEQCLGYEREVNMMTRALLQGNIDGSSLRRIGYSANKMLKKMHDQEYAPRGDIESTILELIEHTLKMKGPAEVMASEWLLIHNDRSAELYKDIQKITSTVIGAVVIPRRIQRVNGTLETLESRPALYLVLNSLDQTIYVPFTEIEAFSD